MAHFDRGYALVIGIANYPYVRPLPASVLNDARAIGAILCDPTRPGYREDRVRLLLDKHATRQGILDGLAWLANTAGEDATAIVYFSGHGGRITSGPQAGNYLFTQCLLEALNGKARHEGDGLLCIFDVVSYVFREVPKRHAEQHPMIFRVNDLDANFPLALYKGGEKSLDGASVRPTTAADLIALLPKPTTLDASNVVAIRDFIDRHYTLDEMEVLCANVAAIIEARTGQNTRLSLGVVGASGKPQKLAAQAIVEYLNRRGCLLDLIEALRRDFPGQV